MPPSEHANACLFRTFDAPQAETLERWLPPRSLSAVYCNHPEPPQQAPSASSRTARPEAAHMLDGRLFDAAATALLPGGTLTIVVRPAQIKPLSLTSPPPRPRVTPLPSLLAALPHPPHPPTLDGQYMVRGAATRQPRLARGLPGGQTASRRASSGRQGRARVCRSRAHLGDTWPVVSPRGGRRVLVF